MKNNKLSIIIEQDENGFFASCPDLQGCYSQGETYEEVMLNIKDAVKLHLQDLIEKNEELPESKSISLSTVEVSV